METATFRKKLIKIITKKIRIDVYVACVALFLIFISALTIINLISTIKLRRQTEFILKEVSVYDFEKNGDNKSNFTEVTVADSQPIIVVDAQGNIITGVFPDKATSTYNPISDLQGGESAIQPSSASFSEEETVLLSPSGNSQPAGELEVGPVENVMVYSNIASDSFSNDYFLNQDKSNMYFDKNATALTFTPVYEFAYQNSCDKPFCGLKSESSKICLNNRCLAQLGGKVYYNGEEVDIPAELDKKNILQIGIHPLKSRWVVSFLINDGNQEMVYLYFFENNKFSVLLGQESSLGIKTKYGRGGGHVDVAGDDNHFVILYSGYEGLGYLYNNGIWQDLSAYFGLRIMSGGFEAQIIKSGEAEKTVWYVCSQDESRPRLIKLWQNGTKQIQGSLDLSPIVSGGAAGCALKSPGELLVAKGSELYLFKDKGFNNSHDYFYYSNNLSSFTGKKVVSARIISYTINASSGYYGIYLSSDGTDWLLHNSEKLEFDRPGGSLYVKAEFKRGDSNYSPWFEGIRAISYQAVD